MLITYNALVDLADNGVISPVNLDRINAASIDVTLGQYIWREDPRGGVVDLMHKQVPGMYRYDLQDGPFDLSPGEFILASTAETFNLPDDISAEFRLKSSGARAGLDQSLAVWCDPGWHGSVLTLELRNLLYSHNLRLTIGMPIGQMVFWRGEPVPVEASYASRGQYNDDNVAQPSKGLR